MASNDKNRNVNQKSQAGTHHTPSKENQHEKPKTESNSPVSNDEIDSLMERAETEYHTEGVSGLTARNIAVRGEEGNTNVHEEPIPGHQGDVKGERYDGRTEPNAPQNQRHQADDIVLPGDIDMPGRKPGSPATKREHDLLMRELKRQMGILRRGRPRDPESPRQQQLREREEKRSRGELHPGRRKYTPEQREAADRAKKEREQKHLEEIRERARAILRERGIEPAVIETMLEESMK